MQGSAPTPQAVGRSFTVGSGVAKLLAVRTLGEVVLGSVCPHKHVDLPPLISVEATGIGKHLLVTEKFF
jgi:hypothetical protein